MAPPVSQDFASRLAQWLWTRKGQGSPLGDLARLPLALAAKLYTAAIRVRAAAYQSGALPSFRAPAKVIVVGNLTVGGAGKTPLAAWIAQQLVARGRPTAILLRGYKGRRGRAPLVVSEGEGPIAAPATAGDEAVFLARRVPGAVVIAAPDRAAAARLAVAKFGARVLVLDDGFQHLRLQRDLDVLILDARADPAAEHLLPRGRLREPIDAAARAGLIVFSNSPGPQPPAWPWLQPLLAQRPAFAMRYRSLGLVDARGQAAAAADAGPALAFAGLGAPQGFFNSLEQEGVALAGRVAFADHQRYASASIVDLTARARSAGARSLITTEKDAVKIEPAWLRGFPLYILRIEPDLFGAEDRMMEIVLQKTKDGEERK